MATNTLARVQAKLVLDPETGCLLWPGHLDRNGYARVGAGRSGHKIGLHVFVWEAVHGPVPPGMQIDHVYSRGCRYRHCGNIMHLEAVTPKTNSGRRDEVHPPIQFCRRGLHELTPENIVPRDDGRRRCRACRHYKGS